MSLRYTGAWMQDGAFNPLVAPSPIYTPETLWSWGYNNFGQLGLNNSTNYSSPKQVGLLTNWLSISSGGYYFNIAVKTNGTLWSWGASAGVGQLGLGNNNNYSSPKQIGALTTWVQASAGYKFACAIRSDGTLWAWGNNNSGQLGLGTSGTYQEKSSPTQVGSLTNWYSVSCGSQHVLSIKTDGTLWSWGSNGGGCLGLNVISSYSSPKQIGALTNWAYASAGNSTSFAIKTDGTMWVWGAGNIGVLGLGNTTSYSSPKQLGTLTNWAKPKLALSAATAMAIKTDGTLWSWGYNDSGQLGLGNVTYYSSPKQIGSLTNWSDVSINLRNVSAVKTDGTLWSWGYGPYGALGLGNTTSYSSPKQVGTLTKWLKVSAGRYYATAIQA